MRRNSSSVRRLLATGSVLGAMVVAAAWADAHASNFSRLLDGRYGIGRPATPAEIRQWDTDVGPDGAGLPAGSGTAAQGAVIYNEKCARCHGAAGEGSRAGPRLVGREPREGFPFGRDPRYVRTIGNYWPYATTVYDYINRAMPFDAPRTLPPSDVYSVVAWLLARNQIISEDTRLDARSLPAVKMPARDRFVRDSRRGGPEIR